MTSPARLFILAIISLSCLTCYAADPSAPANLNITSTVLSDQIEPIGANLTPLAGGTNFAINNNVRSSGFEPAVYRRLVRIDRVGNDPHKWFCRGEQEGGTGYWNLIWTGLGNGAKMRLLSHGRRQRQTSGTTTTKRICPRPITQTTSSSLAKIRSQCQARISHKVATSPTTTVMADKTNDQHCVYLQKVNLNLRFGDYVYITLKTCGMDNTVQPAGPSKKTGREITHSSPH